MVALARLDLGVRVSAISQSEAAIQLTELHLAACQIISPIDGVILDRHCNIGARINAKADAPPLFQIADLSQLKVELHTADEDAAKIKKGQLVSFSIAAYPGETFTGRVSMTHFKPIKTDKGVDCTVIIEPDKSDRTFTPFLKAVVKIDTD